MWGELAKAKGDTIKEPSERPEPAKGSKNVFEKINKVPYEHEYKHAREILALQELGDTVKDDNGLAEESAGQAAPASIYLEALSEPPGDLSAAKLGDRIERIWMAELAAKGARGASLTRALLKAVAPDMVRVFLYGILFKFVGSLLVLESVRRVILSVGKLNMAKLNEQRALAGDPEPPLPLNIVESSSGLLLDLANFTVTSEPIRHIREILPEQSRLMWHPNNSSLAHQFKQDEEVIRDEIGNYIYLLSLSLVLYAVTYANFMFEQARCGLKLRVALTQLLHRKSLRLHLSTCVKEPSSAVVGLISNQAAFVEDANRYLVHVVMAPLSFASGLTWLAVTQTGWQPLVGACVALILSLSSQVCLPRWYRSVSAKQKQYTKERLAAIASYLNSVKTVKMYAWEPIFEKIIAHYRKEELRLVRLLDVFPLFDFVTLFTTIRILSASVFISFLVLNERLTPTVLFTTGLVFNIYVIDIVLLFPRSIKCLVELKEACKRAKAYMTLDEANGREALSVNQTRPARRSPLAEMLSITGIYKRTSCPWSGLKEREQRLEVRLASVSVSLSSDPIQLDVSALGASGETGAGSGPGSGGRNEQLLSAGSHRKSAGEPPEVGVEHSENIINSLSLNMSQGELVVVTGPVGSGKSSLLLTLLGETHITSGAISVSGLAPSADHGHHGGGGGHFRRGFAYAAQEPCIMPGSLRDNILMGRPLEPERYARVVGVCSLTRDLELLPMGDLTQVGPKGVSLSGGQKARLNLARAVYSRAQVYLLDDPLAALDARVARNIFERCIRHHLRDKLVVLATHQLQLVLPKANQLVLLEKGQSPLVGPPTKLLASSEQLRQRVAAMGPPPEPSCSPPATDPSASTKPEVEDNNTKNENKNENKNNRANPPKGQVAGAKSEAGKTAGLAASRGPALGPPCKSPYMLMCRHGLTRLSALALLVSLIIVVPLMGLNEYYFRTWARAEISDLLAEQPVDDSTYFRHSVNSCARFVAIAALTSIVMCIFLGQLAYLKQRASRKLHQKLIGSLFNSRLSFFDFCQPGELSSRYAADFAQLDCILPGVLLHTAFDWCWVSAYVLMILIIQPICALLILLLCLALAPLISRHMKWKNKLIAMSNSLRVPVYSVAALLVESLDTIRSDASYLNYVSGKFREAADKQASASLLVISFNAAISFALKLSAMLVGSVASYLMFVVFWDQVDVAVSGAFFILMITTMIRLPLAFEYMSYIETSFASVRNLSQLLELEPEEDPHKTKPDDQLAIGSSSSFGGKALQMGGGGGCGGAATKSVTQVAQLEKCKLHSSDSYSATQQLAWHKLWSRGQIRFNQVTLRYFANEAPVLNKLSFQIEAGERVGVVGRTGAGKSSIVSILLRLYPFEGSIEIDGIDTKSVGLRKLRSSLGVIPQEPILFCDSLRRNLDPFDAYSDEEIWRALEVVSLRQFVVQNLASDLSSQISEGGRNFSVGQRQLVCLARAVLKSPKVLLIDEATANVDRETDQLIQETIKSYFVSSTIVTIAHRLNTVLDYDRILVLDAGQIVEFDSVSRLLAKEGGVFKSMLASSAAAEIVPAAAAAAAVEKD